MAAAFRRLIRAAGRLPPADEASLRSLMRDVARMPLGEEAFPARLCTSLQSTYSKLRPEGQLGFISLLARQTVDMPSVRSSCEALLATSDGRATEDSAALLQVSRQLREALIPTRDKVIEQMAQQPGGLAFLLSMRRDLLNALAGKHGAEHPKVTPIDSRSVSYAPTHEDEQLLRAQWKDLDESLRQTLAVWFDAGLLRLQQLTYEHSPAALLEKVMRYERVHPMASWDELRKRTDGHNRRLFAFLHERLKGEPLVFVQVALCHEVPSKLAHVIQPVVAKGGTLPSSSAGAQSSAKSSAKSHEESMGADEEIPPPPSVAVFYSISSPFTGLRGVPLGRLLIKQVRDSLAHDVSGLQTYVTLSPVPGFRSWLEARLALFGNAENDAHDNNHVAAPNRMIGAQERACLQTYLSALEDAGLSTEAPFECDSILHADEHANKVGGVHASLMSLCARYLCLARHRQRALDPVAAFHLRNGAELVALHWGANPSRRGCRESAGIMVNYQYGPSLEANHARYVKQGEVIASADVWKLIAPDSQELPPS
jgi:malonyl-CoA decarboxylase